MSTLSAKPLSTAKQANLIIDSQYLLVGAKEGLFWLKNPNKKMSNFNTFKLETTERYFKTIYEISFELTIQLVSFGCVKPDLANLKMLKSCNT